MSAPRILHLSFNHNTGGAARSTYRLHRALRAAGHASHLLCAHRDHPDATVTSVWETVPPRHTVREAAAWMLEKEWVPAQRTGVSDALYSPGALGRDVAGHPRVREADVLNLHWINGLLDLDGVARIAALGKPVVWRLADLWPLTGGCHYPGACRMFETECTYCPLLQTHGVDLARRVFADKLALWPRSRFTLVCPSRWMAGHARRSALFGHARIEVIRTGIDTRTFRPSPRALARRTLGLPPDAFLLAFVAGNLAEHRKGFHLVPPAIAAARRTPAFAEACDAGRVCLALAGTNLPADRPDLAWQHFDHIAKDETLALLYAAADLVLLPVLEDNLPNTLLEPLACGTPVLAFDEGGAGEVLTEADAGWRVPSGSAEALGVELARLWASPQEVARAGRRARRFAETALAVERQAEAYAALYGDLLELTEPAETAALA